MLRTYKNYPQLNIQLTTDELLVVLREVNSWTYGLASKVGLCNNYVYYFTQCPAKYALAHKPLLNCIQLTPIGNYAGLFNVYKAELVTTLDDTLYNQLYKSALEANNEELLDDLKYTNECDNIEKELYQSAKTIRNMVIDYGYMAYIDNYTVNFYVNNNQIYWLDPVIVQTKG